MDTVRVVRILEYVGPRLEVEETLKRSIQGEKRVGNGTVIRAATLGTFPEILQPKESNAQDHQAESEAGEQQRAEQR